MAYFPKCPWWLGLCRAKAESATQASCTGGRNPIIIWPITAIFQHLNQLDAGVRGWRWVSNPAALMRDARFLELAWRPSHLFQFGVLMLEESARILSQLFPWVSLTLFMA